MPEIAGSPDLRLKTDAGGEVLVGRLGVNNRPLRDKVSLEVRASLGGTAWVALTLDEVRTVVAALMTHAGRLEEEAENDGSWHPFRVRQYPGTPPFYRGYCTQCDVYTSAYWDKADVGDGHWSQE